MDDRRTLPEAAALEAALGAAVAPADEYLRMAVRVAEDVGVRLSLQSLLGLAATISNAVTYFADRKVRWVIGRADRRPDGLIAFFVRRSVKAKLPEELRRDDVATLIVAVVAAIVERG